MEQQSIVVVGGGQAAAAFAGKLRSLGVDRPITIVGDEAEPPYQRPPLSKKYLIGELGFDRLLLKPPAWYEVNAVTLRLGAAVLAIDRAARMLTLADGARLAYGTLALCTGARPRRLPAAMGGTLGGLHVMRSKADADALAGELAPGRRLVVVGGGYVGLEAAAVARMKGLEVAVIARSRILRRVVAPETARLVAALHTARGVAIIENAGLERLSGQNGRVAGVRLADGREIAADLAVLGIGAVPNVELAAAAGLDVDDGIVVDERCRTADPDIYAFGDCAAFPWRGGRIRLESVQNAHDQGEAAAAAVAGIDGGYDPHPWFWSDQYDAKLQIAGLGRGHSSVLVQDGPRPGSHAVWYFRGEEMIAVDALNHPAAYMAGKKLLEAGRKVSAGEIAERPLRELVR